MPNETNFASSTNASEKFLFECRLGVTRGLRFDNQCRWKQRGCQQYCRGIQRRVHRIGMIDRRGLLVNIDYGKRFGCVCGMKADRVS
jgi:hypothetical protein